MADDGSALLKGVNEAEALVKDFMKLGKSTLTDLKKFESEVKSHKATRPMVEKFGWSKKVAKLTDNKKIIDAVFAIEKSKTRKSCEAAAKLMKGDKKLAPLLDEIERVLKGDEALAKKISGAADAAKKRAQQAEKFLAGGKSFEKAFKSNLKDVLTEVKAAKSDPKDD
ncbi:MAG: hypothetical protein BM562_15100 [Alphaproteobacteria bacterium MedPE-SWcel]|nr:MAG: hypothetical protein BM562_15100 [Alphaproteobacteria bacterium MedPE-SWcel]